MLKRNSFTLVAVAAMILTSCGGEKNPANSGDKPKTWNIAGEVYIWQCQPKRDLVDLGVLDENDFLFHRQTAGDSALVSLTAKNGAVFESFTNSSSKFKFENVPPGSCAITIRTDWTWPPRETKIHLEGKGEFFSNPKDTSLYLDLVFSTLDPEQIAVVFHYPVLGPDTAREREIIQILSQRAFQTTGIPVPINTSDSALRVSHVIMHQFDSIDSRYELKMQRGVGWNVVQLADIFSNLAKDQIGFPFPINPSYGPSIFVELPGAYPCFTLTSN